MPLCIYISNNNRTSRKYEQHSMKSENMAEAFKNEIVQRICRCLLDIHVLILIKKRPLWGYKLKQDLRASFNVTLRHGTLYPLLSNLEERGLLTSHTQRHKGRERKVYKVTRKGLQYLRVYKSIMKKQIHLIETSTPTTGTGTSRYTTERWI